MYALELLDRAGLAFTSRWLHILVGITWIGLLYYFNLVQVPAFAEMSAGSRTEAIEILAKRALWWFRWAAVATVLTGLMILGFTEDYFTPGGASASDWAKSPNGISISTGILIALDHVRERLGDHLAQPEDRHRIGRAGACRWRAAARGCGRWAPRGHGVTAERFLLVHDDLVHDVHEPLLVQLRDG